MMQKFAVGLTLMAIFAPFSVSSSQAVQYSNQKPGQFCKQKDLGATVTLSSGSKLKCLVVKGGFKPHWVLTPSKVVNSASPKFPEIKQGLLPAFPTTYSSNDMQAQLVIQNFDSEFEWFCSVSSGICAVDKHSGTISLSAFEVGKNLILSVKSSRVGYTDESNSLSFTPKLRGISPIVRAGSNQQLLNGASFQVDNFDSSWTWTVSASSGSASVDGAGLVTVSALNPDQLSIILVSAQKVGYIEQSTSVQVSSLPVFKSISTREWQLIAKDPRGNMGSYIVVYGHITQFDSSTGLSSFRADVSGADLTSSGYWIGGDNTFLSGDSNMLKTFVQNDTFVAKVKVVGVYTYTSTFNGQISAPELQIYAIDLVR